jgi:fructokinase
MTDTIPAVDLLTIGEILIDFISTEPADSLRDAEIFQRYLGGSPANIATNVSRLGCSAALIAKTGIGAFGQFLKGALQRNGVRTDYLIMDHRFNTSVIFVSRTSGTPDFEPFRSADFNLTPDEISEEVIVTASILHTSTWPLSLEPSRSAVIKAFRIASEHNKIISFDPNYSPVVWPEYKEAQEVMREILSYTTITKASLDDSHRFFGEGYTPEQYIQMFHDLGPKMVVFTMGPGGSMISENGRLLGHLPARKIEVKDATGAGDAFWAGFLTALLDGHPSRTCLLFAREVVELKLQTVGTLPAAIDRNELYARLPDVDEAFDLN